MWSTMSNAAEKTGDKNYFKVATAFAKQDIFGDWEEEFQWSAERKFIIVVNPT